MANAMRSVFLGWRVVAAAFLALFVAFGAMYAFAAFFAELEREFSASRADVSLVFSLAGFLYFAVGAVSGTLADRAGTRPVVMAGFVLLAAGLLLAARAESLRAVYLFYGLGVGLGVGFVYVPALAAVQRWFDRRRGLASGFTVAGIGAGTLAMPPLAGLLIAQAGWRDTYLLLAGLVLVLGAIATAMLEHSPEQRGLPRDGRPTPAVQPPAGLGLREALRSRPFWLLYLAGVCTSFGMFIPFVHLAPYAIDQGLSERFGVLLVGLVGLGSMIGRFALGGTADRIGRRWGVGLMFSGMAAMLLLWLAASGQLALIVFAVLFGTFYGGYVALIPALTADYFGSYRVAGIIGCLYTGVGIGTLFGPTLAGLAFDLAGSYTIPITAGVIANLAALTCIAVIEEPERFRAGQA